MGLVVLVLPGTPEASIGAETAEQLAALGISRVCMLRGDEGLAVVLEGWAFDAEAGTPDVLAIMRAAGSARTFRQVAETSVSPGGVVTAAEPSRGRGTR